MTRFTEEQIDARLCHIENIYIETEITERARKALSRRLGSANRRKGLRRKPKLAWMTAETGCGKTSLVQTFVADVNGPVSGKIGDYDCEKLMALHVILPTPCTIKSLSVAILTALRDPLSHRYSTTGDNTDRIVTMAQERGVRLLILDEVQHLIDPERDKVIKSTAQWLKRTIDVTNLPVVCVGLPDSHRVFTGEKQLQRRTSKFIPIRPFLQEETREFRGFLKVYEEQLGFADRSNLSEPRTAQAIFSVTGGLLGNLAQLFSEAAEISMDREEGPDAITIDDLGHAFDELPFEGRNPFTLTHKRKIEVNTEPALNEHARNARKSASPDA